MNADVWEPWKPEIGQRVTVRLSSECDVAFWGDGGIRGHPPELDGVVGIVQAHSVEPRLGPWIVLHPYCVVFDVPVSIYIHGPTVAECNYFAAAELEVLG